MGLGSSFGSAHGGSTQPGRVFMFPEEPVSTLKRQSAGKYGTGQNGKGETRDGVREVVVDGGEE